MAIDHSIYFRQETPDLLGSYMKGVSFKDMMGKVKAQDEAMKEQEAIKNAYKSGVVQGPDGKVSLDREKTLAGLLKVNPVVAYKQQTEWDTQDLEAARNKTKASLDQIDLSSRLLSGVDSQETFDKALATAKQFGIDTQALGKYYDPLLIDRYQVMSLSAKDNLDKKYKDLEYQLKNRNLDITEQNNLANQNAKMTGLAIQGFKAKSQAEMSREKPSVFDIERQKASARDFQKNQKNLSNVNKNLNMIDDAMNSLKEYSKNSTFGTGPFATAYGLAKYTNEDLQTLNAKLRAVNLKNMTTTFSGMSKAIDSDAERRAWQGTQADIANDDSTNMNILLGQKSILLKDKAEAQAQNQYVLERGNLDGYESPIDGKVTSMVSPSGEVQLVPNEKVNKSKTQGFLTLDQYAKRSVKGRGEIDSRPQTVIQNGFTYTLNPETGEYE